MTTAVRPTQVMMVSRLPEWERDHRNAIDAALHAVAAFLLHEVERRLRLGYTTGEFTPDEDERFPGTVADTLDTSTPKTEKRQRVIRVGSTSPLALFWEVGHENVFTHRFERVPIWKSTAVQNLHRMQTLFATTYQSKMAKWDASRGGGR